MAEIRHGELAESPSVAEPVARGKFAIYQTPQGGVHLVLQMDGEDEPRHVELPKMVVKMMMARGKMMGLGDGME